MNPKVKMLLFDIDGTLLLTGGAGRVAINTAFQKVFGITDAWGDLIPDGKTDPQIFQEIIQRTHKRPLQVKEFETLYQKYLASFRTEIDKAPNYRLMPGVKALLEELSGEKDILLGIQTGNMEETAWIKLQRGSLRSYFGFGGFGSDSPDRREIIAKAIEEGRKTIRQPISLQQIFIIGDAPQDIKAGKELGLRTIAVATGRTSREELGTYQPDCVLENLMTTDPFFQLLNKKRKKR